MPVKQKTSRTELDVLASAVPAEHTRLGYGDTLREILQQPDTWRATAAALASHPALAAAVVARPTHIVFTGSGSSLYVGDALASGVQQATGIPCTAVGAGALLTHLAGVLPRGAGLLVSIGRSGDSPESHGAVSRVLRHAPDYRHLVLTCNADGLLATGYRDEERLQAVLLDERTNDRSLVMTSSFTNLLLAGAMLGTTTPHGVEAAANAAETVIDQYSDALAALARGDVRRVVYLGSGGAVGIARESALKMLEMTTGRVTTMAETFLGLRHGPMASIDAHTLVVAFLSSDPVIRAYENDVLDELAAKKLGLARVAVGSSPRAMAGSDLIIALPTLAGVDDTLGLLPAAVVGQLLAFFRCLALGLTPDTPSQGVLTRVVGAFALHGEGTP